MKSGTSFATAYVSGAAAVLLSLPNSSSLRGAALVKAEIDADATQGLITGLPDSLSPNKILYLPSIEEGSSITLAKTSTGALQAFGVKPDGRAVTATQSGPNAASWSSLTAAETNGSFLSVGAGAGSDKRVQFVGLRPQGDVWQRQQVAIGSSLFTLWDHVDGLLQSVAVARNQSGALELLGVNAQGTAFYTSQISNGSIIPIYNPWQSFPGPVPDFTSVSAETDAAGMIEAFIVDTHGDIWRTVQTAPNSTSWTALTEMTATNHRLVSEVAVALDGNSDITLIGIDDQGIWQRTQTSPGSSSFTGWTSLNALAIMPTHVAAEANANGTVQAIVVDITGTMFSSAQSAPGSTIYGNWNQIPGSLIRS